ncbi:MAG: VanZ family protein [Woeseiaceae bacterium]
MQHYLPKMLHLGFERAVVFMDSLTKKRRVYLFFILLCLLIYLFAGFYPFQFKAISSGQLNNGAILTPGQGLYFQSPGIASTEEAPPWLPNAIATSGLELSLEVRVTDQEQSGPARIFTLSLNTSNRNLTVGQVGSDLVVRMRHGYTSLNGTPNYTIKEVFNDPGWHQIDVRITSKALEISVDGDILAIAPMPDQPFESWDPSFRLALGNELSGNRPWLGSIRKAVVRVGNEFFDYLANDALNVPEIFTMSSDRVIKLVPFLNYQYYRARFIDWGTNFMCFVPFGWLLVMFRKPRSGVFLATLLSAGVSATIETTQLLFLIDRFPSTEDLILNTLGGAMGAWLAEHFEFSVKRLPA